jgi:tetratricopeptide (TPR) repeat protein
MNRSVQGLALVVTLALLFAAAGCGKLKARDQLNKGVQSFKNAKYEEAIEHFKNAVSLDPSLLTARLYLGTAYMQQYIPGADTPENNRNAELAITEFKDVLASPSPTKEQKLHGLKSIAFLYYNMKDFEKSKDFYRQATQVDQNDPEIYYMVGVIDWVDTYKTAAETKAKIGLKVDDEYKKSKDDLKTCAEVRAANEAKVKDGFEALNQALKLRPEYEDAMVYMNLLYRRKADMECGNSQARMADLKIADQWSEKTITARKAKAEKEQQASGIVVDQQSGK